MDAPMPAFARAHLLLPTPVGLVHYDVLEETAFVGPAPKGGLTASPAPFREAKVLLADEGGALVVRALPGEPPPDVNGAPGEGRRLEDGDRLRLGDHVALIRLAAAVAPALAAAPASRPESLGADAAGTTSPRGRRPAAPARAESAKGLRAAATTIALVGAALLLVAAYVAVDRLQTPGPGKVPPIPPTVSDPRQEPAIPRLEERAAKEYAAAQEYELTHPTDMVGAADRYRAIVSRKEYEGVAYADRAAARLTEIWPKAAAEAWGTARSAVDTAATSRRFRTALQTLDEFEARFAGTPAAAGVPERRAAVRTAARAALDALRERVTPLMASDATRAYRLLTTSGLELPPDLDEELGAMMRRVRELWPHPDATPPPDPAGTSSKPPDGRGPGPIPLPPPPPREPEEAEAAARALWVQARADLGAKRWTEARKAYSDLLKNHASTTIVTNGKEKIRAGRKAADLALRGPPALLREEAEWKNGRLEVEYSFDDVRSFTEDFTVEQPFAGNEPLTAEVRAGMAILSGSTAILTKVVFDPTDVQWEADCVADEHRDYGLIGLQEGNEYKSVAMNVGNTQFKLKKGSAAKVLPGHVLWLYGDGVWRDADPGSRGFVRIDVKNSNSLRGGEKATVKVEMHGDRIGGEIHAKSENVDLEGKLVGDDGKGIGPVRVGCFAYTGRVGIDRLKIIGKPDPAWLQKQFDDLRAQESGPD
jgi:hypothetical protein